MNGQDVKATELIDLEVDRVDAVENPATGRGFLIRKMADAPDPNASGGDKKKPPKLVDDPTSGYYSEMKKEWIDPILKGLFDMQQQAPQQGGQGFGGFPPQLAQLMQALAGKFASLDAGAMFKEAPAKNPNQAGEGGSAAGDKGPANAPERVKIDVAEGAGAGVVKLAEVVEKQAALIEKQAAMIEKMLTGDVKKEAPKPDKKDAPKSTQPEGQDEPEGVRKSAPKKVSWSNVVFGENK